MGLLKRLKQSLFGSFLSSKKKKRKVSKLKRPKKKSRKRRPLRRRKVGRTKKKIPKKRPKKKTLRAAPKEPGIRIGEIVHYFPNVHAGVIRVDKTGLRVGDTIVIEGATTKIKQKVKSLQINRIPIDEAKKGEEVGLEVKKRVRGGDVVYKVT